MTTGIGWRQPHYRELLERRPLPDIGFIEVHSENFFADGGAALAVLDQGRAQYPVSLHGVGLGLGSAAGLDDWHLDRLAALVQRVDPVRVSDHASFARAPLAAGGPVVHGTDLLPIAFTPAALDILVANVQRVQERLRRPLLVENISAYLQWRSPPDALPEAEFFNALVRRSGCQLLLDVNNLVVNAVNAGASRWPRPANSSMGWMPAASARSTSPAMPTRRAWPSTTMAAACGPRCGRPTPMRRAGSARCPR